MINSFYFSHDFNARNDPKIKRLFMRHGVCGYGLFWAIIEDLYQNANALPTDYESIAFDLRSDCETVKSVINDFGLFVTTGNIFHSDSVQRRLDARSRKNNQSDKHWNWKGGIASPNKVIRNSLQMKDWRKRVFKRDLYTCQECFKKNCKLNAHHIKPFALYPELRVELTNGITLCKECHIELHKKEK